MTRLLADIVGLTPSAYEAFDRCPRLFYCGDLLGIAPSDPTPSGDQGLLVHDMLRRIHTTGSCHDADHVTAVLAGHGADSKTIESMIEHHARRCPSNAVQRGAHEQELARFHRVPVPMFMATARIDAIWVHDGLLDARDYKTSLPRQDRVCDIPAASVQVFVLARAAQRRGLRLRLRYEYLRAEVTDDPESWEPDDEELDAVEERLRATVARMWNEREWRGIGEADVCGTCRYRSICRDSATPGEPVWTSLAVS
jgi:hypothetical protein